MADDDEGKRCMTHLKPDTLRRVTEERQREQRSESKMLAILVEEALANREAKAQAA